MKQLALDLAQTPPATLANFVVGRNGELIENVRRLSARAAHERFLYVWGTEGSGRTHLLRGAAAAAQAAGMRAEYIACRSSMRGPAAADVALLAADDVNFLDEAGQMALFSLYNSLRENGGALLASGDAPPAGLRLRRDLVTRLGWGLVYQVHALTDEEKIAALKRQAEERGFALGDEVCGYLIARLRRDMPSLIAVLHALDRYSLQAKRPITVALAREFLQRDERNGED